MHRASGCAKASAARWAGTAPKDGSDRRRQSGSLQPADRQGAGAAVRAGQSSRAEVRGARRRRAGAWRAAEVRAHRDARAARGPARSGSRCARRSIRGCSDRAAATSSSASNVVLRHPHKIHIGDNVVIDDNCLLDAKGEIEPRHPHRRRRVRRPQHHPVVQERRHRAGRRRQHRLQLRDVFGQPGAPRQERAAGGLHLRHRRRPRVLRPVEVGARADANVDRRRRSATARGSARARKCSTA